MQLGHCGRYGTPCVIVDTIDEVDPDCLIDLALLRGAIVQDDGEERYVIQFPGVSEAELLTEVELRLRVARHTQTPCMA